jgi:hypothetical protein
MAYNRAIVAGEKANAAAVTFGEDHQRTKAWRNLQFVLWNMYLKILEVMSNEMGSLFFPIS